MLTTLVLSAAACGGGSSGSTGSTPTTIEPSSTSSPFTVGPAPAGHQLVAAGTGTAEASWGDDITGTDEPVTVLSPDGTATSDDVVLVSITGFEGYQGELAQASAGYLENRFDEFTVDGRPAIHVPASDGGRHPSHAHWADLVAVRGDDLAVRVTTPEASREELLAVLEQVEVPADRSQAPAVPDPPHRLRVAGSVHLDAIVADRSGVIVGSEEVPGPPSAHSAGWAAVTSGDGGGIVVQTIPGRAADLAAVAALRRNWLDRKVTATERRVDGRPAVVVERRAPDRWTSRAVWLATSWGDLVVVKADGDDVPGVDELLALAASVRPTDEATWEAFVVEASGGPGLHPDPGRTEITRGRVDDLEWLLQSGDGWNAVDDCLKLSNRERACSGDGGSSTGSGGYRTSSGEHGMPAHTVVWTDQEAAAVRVTTSTREATAPLAPTPDGRRAAVVLLGFPGWATCPGPASPTANPPPAREGTRIDLLDAGGAVVGCVGP